MKNKNYLYNGKTSKKVKFIKYKYHQFSVILIKKGGVRQWLQKKGDLPQQLREDQQKEGGK